MRPPGPTPRVGPGGGYSLRPHAAATGSNSTGGGAAAAAAAAVAGNDSAGHGDAVAPTYPRSPHVKSSDRVLWAFVVQCVRAYVANVRRARKLLYVGPYSKHGAVLDGDLCPGLLCTSLDRYETTLHECLSVRVPESQPDHHTAAPITEARHAEVVTRLRLAWSVVLDNTEESELSLCQKITIECL